jgi:DNA repair exonuclease SbcCD ATPase subunit
LVDDLTEQRAAAVRRAEAVTVERDELLEQVVLLKEQLKSTDERLEHVEHELDLANDAADREGSARDAAELQLDRTKARAKTGEVESIVSEGLELRPEVVGLARAMERRLREHDFERPYGWKRNEPDELLARLQEEATKLEVALQLATSGDEPPGQILWEAADVANFAMMVADVSGVLMDAGSIASEGDQS